MTPPQEDPTTGLVRDLGLTEAMAIGLGAMGGAGVFVLAALALEQAGPGAALSFVLAGLICLPITLVISELATGAGRAGGSYALIARALGPLAGGVVGPGNWLGLTFAGGFFLIALGGYLSVILHVADWATTLAVGVAFTYLNYRGAKASGKFQNVIVFVFMGILLLFSFGGLFRIRADLYHPFFPAGFSQVAVTVGMVIVSYTGFEKISTLAEEIRNPRRNLPIAIISVVLVAMVLYAVVLLVTAGLLPMAVIAGSETPLVDAAARVAGPVGRWGMLAAGLLATASSANAAVIASSRISFAMGRDRILPGWLEAVHPKLLTPHRAVLATGALATLVALSGQAEILAEISSALFMVNYMLLCISLLVMRHSRPSWYRPTFRAPLYPLVPVIGALACGGVILSMRPISQIASGSLILLSLAWYLSWGRYHARVHGEAGPMLQRERPLEQVAARVARAAESRGGEILLPVSNPLVVRGLITLAMSIRERQAVPRLVLLRVVPVQIHMPLAQAQAFLATQNARHGNAQLVSEAASTALEAGAEVVSLIRAAHDIPSGIVGTARSRPDTRLILMSWQGVLTSRSVSSSIVNQVVRTASCDTAVYFQRHERPIQRVLVPVGGGPHARFGLRLARDLAVGGMCQVTSLRVVRAGPAVDVEAEATAVARTLDQELGAERQACDATTLVVQSTSVVEGILVEAARGYDLIIIGASEEWALRNWLMGAIPDIIAERAPCSVLMVRKHEPAGVSWFRRRAQRPGGFPTRKGDTSLAESSP